MVGIGVGDSGRSDRENQELSFFHPLLLSPKSRVAGPRWQMKSLLGCGRSTGRSMNWSRIESAHKFGFARDSKLANSFCFFAHQGFQVSDEEIEMDLAQFRQLYANQMGMIEYARLSFLPTEIYLPAPPLPGLQPEPTQFLYGRQRRSI